jgi:hypothetical protein
MQNTELQLGVYILSKFIPSELPHQTGINVHLLEGQVINDTDKHCKAIHSITGNANRRLSHCTKRSYE